MLGRASRKGVRFVARWEGFRSCPYRDAVGVLTVGFGTTSAERPISGCISRETARKWLRQSLNRKYVKAIPRRRRMKQQERDALASFAYNLGPGAVNDPMLSTLARRLLGPEGKRFKTRKRIYREEIPKWDKAGGKTLAGLTKRRAAEVRLAVNGDYSGRP
jgi:lysozyme